MPTPVSWFIRLVVLPSRRTQITILFNDNWTTSASYLRVRSTGQSRFRFWNPDFVRPWIFFISSFFGISAEKCLKNCCQEQRPSCTRTHNQHRPMFRNLEKFCLWSAEYWSLKSGIPLTIGVRDPSSTRTKTISLLRQRHAAKTIFFQESAIVFFSVNWVAGSLLITPQFQEPIRSTCSILQFLVSLILWWPILFKTLLIQNIHWKFMTKIISITTFRITM